MNLDAIADEFIIPGCVPINVVNSIDQLNLKRENKTYSIDYVQKYIKTFSQLYLSLIID